MSEAAYRDDTAIPVTIKDATKIVEKTVATVNVVYMIFFTFHLDLFFMNRKTEALPWFRGKGSLSEKRQLAASENKVAFTFLGKKYWHKFVDHYKHVGTNFWCC